MANTDTTHLPGDVFSTPAFILEVDQSLQFNGDLGSDDPVGDVIRDNPLTAGPDSNYLQYTGDEHVVLGGTDGDDIMIAAIGDDTLYGDGGNDRLDGGDGVDMTLGGAGDDIITDKGGEDNLQGGDGNDAIHGGNSIDLILGGHGNDFIVTGEDGDESFGGPGNDFILGDAADEFVFGNEGDDWLEHGMADGAAGENFATNGMDDIIGNDVFMGDTNTDRMLGEGGDDIMNGNGGASDRYMGGSGFDWAMFKHATLAAEADMNIRAFNFAPVAPSITSVLARFEETEGLSGSQFSDILRGDVRDAAAIAVSGAQGSVLTNMALITGLQAFLDEVLGGPVTSFGAGNIILGGDGSDIIEGRGGDDIVDGDRALNVRIAVHENTDGSGAIMYSVDSMTDLVADIFEGTVNPGQLAIVREILEGNGAFNFDTAVFSGNSGDYTITVNDQGTADFSDDVVTVADSVAGRDGTDTLRHIERLQFADEAVVLVPGLNAEPVGSLILLDDASGNPDNTPTEGQTLRASIAGVTDADNPGGTITGPVAYTWQVETRPGTGVFDDILIVTELGTSLAIGPTYTPDNSVSGLLLRVRAIYQDANGVFEQVFSEPATVINVNQAPVGALLITDTTPAEDQIITAFNGFTDADGLTAATFLYQWQELIGAVWTDIAGAEFQSFAADQSQVGHELRVSVTYTDDGGTTELLMSAATAPVSQHQRRAGRHVLDRQPGTGGRTVADGAELRLRSRRDLDAVQLPMAAAGFRHMDEHRRSERSVVHGHARARE